MANRGDHNGTATKPGPLAEAGITMHTDSFSSCVVPGGRVGEKSRHQPPFCQRVPQLCWSSAQTLGRGLQSGNSHIIAKLTEKRFLQPKMAEKRSWMCAAPSLRPITINAILKPYIYILFELPRKFWFYNFCFFYSTEYRSQHFVCAWQVVYHKARPPVLALWNKSPYLPQTDLELMILLPPSLDCSAYSVCTIMAHFYELSESAVWDEKRISFLLNYMKFTTVTQASKTRTQVQRRWVTCETGKLASYG